MQPISETQIRASLVNASLRERKNLVLPPNFPDLRWDSLDYLGWRDGKIPDIGYVITWLDDNPVGILVRQSDGHLRSRPQCSWCEDVQLPNEVVFFSAKRSGEAGRHGNTIGTLACSHFECSANVRKRPPMAYIGFDVDAAIEQRIAALRVHVERFVRDVRDGE